MEQPIIATRTWTVHTDAQARPILHGALGISWPSAHTHATCLGNQILNPTEHNPQDTPNDECTCGIYATKLTQNFDRDMPFIAHDLLRVTSDVALHGTVIEHENGWRASDATILGPIHIMTLPHPHTLHPQGPYLALVSGTFIWSHTTELPRTLQLAKPTLPTWHPAPSSQILELVRNGLAERYGVPATIDRLSQTHP